MDRKMSQLREGSLGRMLGNPRRPLDEFIRKMVYLGAYPSSERQDCLLALAVLPAGRLWGQRLHGHDHPSLTLGCVSKQLLERRSQFLNYERQRTFLSMGLSATRNMITLVLSCG